MCSRKVAVALLAVALIPLLVIAPYAAESVLAANGPGGSQLKAGSTSTNQEEVASQQECEEYTMGDWSYIFTYVLGYPPASLNTYDKYDRDSIPGVTHNDLLHLFYQYSNYTFPFPGGVVHYCGPFPDTVLPVTNDTVEIRNTRILPGTSIQALEIWLKAKDEYVGFYLPLDISCSSSDVNIEAVHPRDSVYAAGAFLRDALGATFDAGEYRLALVWLSVTASAETQYIAVDTVAPVFSRRTSRLVRASLPQIVTVPGCCTGSRGNANGDIEDKINISDITYLVDYLFGIPTGFPPPCREEGNANGDPDEKVNVSDVSYLLAYMFGNPQGPPPPACPDY